VFKEEREYSEVTIDYGEFQVACMEQHYNIDTEDMDEADLHNFLMKARTCHDFRTSAKICKHCGRRGRDGNKYCPDNGGCGQPFEE
jgi:hypothetical protein